MTRVFVIPLAAMAGIMPMLHSKGGLRLCTNQELCAPLSSNDEHAHEDGPRGLPASRGSSVTGTGSTGPSGSVR
jgi:hypothetical protein